MTTYVSELSQTPRQKQPYATLTADSSTELEQAARRLKIGVTAGRSLDQKRAGSLSAFACYRITSAQRGAALGIGAVERSLAEAIEAAENHLFSERYDQDAEAANSAGVSLYCLYEERVAGINRGGGPELSVDEYLLDRFSVV